MILCIIFTAERRLMSKRDKILETTLDLISEVGFHATSINLIIKKSNVASGTIYYHFKNKEALIDTLYAELRREMGEAIIQNLDQELNFKEKFFLLWNNLLSFYLQNPKKFEFLEDYSNSPLVKKEIKAINRRHYQAAIDFFKSGISLGILRNIPLDLMINLVFGNISTVARMLIMLEIDFSQDLIHDTIQSSWDSVKIN